jgi:hypothetical protein
MTLALAITINVLLDLALVGALAFVMTRPTKLRPATPAVKMPATAELHPPTIATARSPRRAKRYAARLHAAVD